MFAVKSQWSVQAAREFGQILAGSGPDVSDQIVTPAVGGVVQRQDNRVCDVLDQDERQRISSVVPTNAMLGVVEEPQARMKWRCPLADHQAGAENRDWEARLAAHLCQ